MINLTGTVVTRSPGTVTARAGRSHTVQADDGRVLIADSPTPYNPGARVTVVSGTIVGSAGAPPIVKNFQQ